MEPTALPPEDGSTILSRLWDTIRFGGPLQLAGLLAIVLALALLVGSPYLARRPRHFVLLIVAAVLLGTAGYVAVDIRYVMINFAMRDVAQVRADCEKLRAALHAAGGTERYLAAPADTDFPASFTRLGAARASVYGDSVYIDVGFDGYLYCPDISRMSVEGGKIAGPGAPAYGRLGRRTLYRDFYHFMPFDE